MVTAAVYWSFNSSRERILLTYQHWAGVKHYTSSYDFAVFCVFSKQSLPSLNKGQLISRMQPKLML